MFWLGRLFSAWIMTSDDNLVGLFLHNHNDNVTASSSATFIRGPQVVLTHRLSVQTHKNWGQPVWHDAEQTDRPPNDTHTHTHQFIHKYTHREGESSENHFLSLLKWHIKCGGEVSVCAMCVCASGGGITVEQCHISCFSSYCHGHQSSASSVTCTLLTLHPDPCMSKTINTSHHTHICTHALTYTQSEYEPPGSPGVSMFSWCACVCLYMAEFPLGPLYFISNWFGLFRRSHCSVVNQAKAHTHAELSLGH